MVRPLFDVLVADSRPMLYTLLGAVAAMLLIACVNLANLSLARAAGRAQEMAVRRSLGANRAQVARAHATEFAVIGALAGLFAALGATALGYAVASNLLNLPYRIDPLVWLIGFCAGVGGVLAAGMLFTRRVLATPPLTSLRQLG